MAEIQTPGKPIMHSSVDAMRKAVEAKNASQKVDLMHEGAQAAKRLHDRVGSLEKQLEALRQRIEILEAEEGVGGSPYSDGPMKGI